MPNSSPNLRPIRPLPAASLRGVQFNEEIGEKPVTRWVDPASLLVDEKYQRGLSERSISLIRRIVAEFDWASFKAPVVIETEDGLKVTDGQHSAIAAATHPKINKIPVLISRNRTLAGQAKSFMNQNVNRVAVTPTQLHHSALVAGDEVSLHIQRICDDVGVRIPKSPPAQGAYKPGDTMAIGTLRNIYDSRGPAKLRVILDLLKTRHPITSMEIMALDALMHDPDYRVHFDAEAARAIVVASSDYEAREAEAVAATHMKPKYMALAMVWFRRMPRKIVQAPVLRRSAS